MNQSKTKEDENNVESSGYVWKEKKKTAFELAGIKPRFLGVRDGFGGKHQFGQSTTAGSLKSGTLNPDGIPYNTRDFKRRISRKCGEKKTIKLKEANQKIVEDLCQPNSKLLSKKLRDKTFIKVCQLVGLHREDLLPRKLSDFRPKFGQGPCHPSKTAQEQLLTVHEVRRRKNICLVIDCLSRFTSKDNETEDQSNSSAQEWLRKKRRRNKEKISRKIKVEKARLKRLQECLQLEEEETEYLRKTTEHKNRIISRRLHRREMIHVHHVNSQRAQYKARRELNELSRIEQDVKIRDQNILKQKLREQRQKKSLLKKNKTTQRNKNEKALALARAKVVRLQAVDVATQQAAHKRLRKEATAEMLQVMKLERMQLNNQKKAAIAEAVNEKRKHHKKKEKMQIKKIQDKIDRKNRKWEERCTHKEKLRKQMLHTRHLLQMLK